ncbi:MAG: class I SAM-dependent methyltransferase [Hyphomicrobiaceae bacterium]
MWYPLKLLLRRIVMHGDLTVVDGSGTSHRFGDGTPPCVVMRLADRSIERQLAFDPQLILGEAYMTGRLRMEQGLLYDLLALLLGNIGMMREPRALARFDLRRRLLRRLVQFNPVMRARRNVKHHYDIDTAIYDLFLDSDRQYSCAYFAPGSGLEEAQLAKKRHLAAKLLIRSNHYVLDIGCGWGGLALYLAKATGCSVTGITLSDNQLAFARRRAEQQGLAGAVRFELEDYRCVRGTFDRIVSVGMFEHVGVAHYGTFFRKLAELLRPDGVAIVHSIGRADGPGFTNPFIGKYIFPGGYFPALSEVLPAAERAGLIVGDVEVLRLHYAETLRAWRERFMAGRGTAAALKGETFCRMWEYYLAAAEASFRYYGLMVFQLQLIKRIDALPITRDYMFAEERRLADAERGHP